jgi:hypothetical protein
MKKGSGVRGFQVSRVLRKEQREGDGDEAKKKEFPHNGSCGAAFMRNDIILE